MTPCTPAPPCETDYPLFCEPLETTNTAKAFVVEDSLFCQKRLTGNEGDIPRITDGFIKFTQATPANTPNTVVSRDSTGGVAFSSISGTELFLNNPTGDTRIEVGGSGNVYMDLKNPNSDDYDLRIQAAGTTPRIFTNAAILQIDGTSVNLQSNTNGNVGIGTNAPAVKLDVSQTQAAQTAVRVVNTDTSSAASASYLAVQGGVSADFSAKQNAQLDIGTSSTHPVIIKSNDVERIRVTSGGNVGIGTPTPTVKLQVVGGIVSTDASAGVGYATGAGGTVTQGTSRTTPVTINKICGSITMFSSAGAATWSSFVVNNTTISATDTILLSFSGGSNTYLFITGKIIAGTSFEINFVSLAGTAIDAPVINFTIIKSVTA
jgi:hypothetical protein